MANAKAIRAGSAYVELNVNDRMAAGLRKAAARLKALGASVRRIGVGLIGIGTSVVAPLALMTKSAAEAGSKLFDMSKRTGISVEELSKFGFAAEQTGTDLEAFELAVRNLQKTQPGKTFEEAAAEIKGIADPAEQAARAMQLFGKGGTALIPMIEDLAALKAEAEALGVVMSTAEAQSLDTFGDALDALGTQAKAVRNQLGLAIAQAVLPFMEGAKKIVKQVIDWVKVNRGFVVGVAAIAGAVIAAGAGFVVLGTVLTGVGAVLGSIAAGLAAVVSPIALVTGALAIGGFAFLKYTDTGAAALAWLADKFGQLKEIAVDAFKGIADALAAGNIRTAAEILWTGLELAFVQGTAGLRNVWTAFKLFFVTTAANAFFGVLEVWTKVSSALQTLWAAGAAAFKSIWRAAIGVVQNALIDVQLQVGLAQAKSEEERVILRKAAGGLKEKVQEAGAADDERAASELAKRLTDIERQKQATILALQTAQEAFVKAAVDASGAEIVALQKRIAELRAQLEQQTGAASEARKEMDLRREREKKEQFDMDGIARGLSSRGTFNAGAAQSLQGGGENRMVTAIQAVEAAVKDVARKIGKSPVVV